MLICSAGLIEYNENCHKEYWSVGHVGIQKNVKIKASGARGEGYPQYFQFEVFLQMCLR